MQMYTRQSWRILAIALLTFMVLSLTGCESIPDEAKPDVHLTFDIHRDGSNATILEVAVHPLVDPLLQPVLFEIQQLIAEQEGRTVEIKQTTREGRKYSAFVLEFNSIADLNAFMNTPELLNGIVGEWIPDVAIPVPFAEFNAWHNEEKRPEEYGLRARMDSEATSILTAVNVSTHVILPMRTKEHNASSVTDETLNWKVESGQPFEMDAIAKPSGIGGLLGGDLGTPLLIILGTIAALMVPLGLALWLKNRRSKDIETADDLWIN